MALKLKGDVFFTVGTGSLPVDLVSKTTKKRVGLSEDEAAVAMLLMEGTPGSEKLLGQLQKHGVSWRPTELNRYLDRLARADLLQDDATAAGAAADASVGAGRYEVSDTDVDTRFLVAEDEDEDEDEGPTGVPGIEAVRGAAEQPVPGMLRPDLSVRQLADGSVEVSDPSGQLKQCFAPNALRVAQLFDGMRTCEDIVASAQMAGIPASREAVEQLAQMLQARGLLVEPPPMTGPLPRIPPSRITPPAPPARPETAESEDAEVLAAALVMIRDRSYGQARQLVQPLLDRSPNHLHARTLLQLIEAEEGRAASLTRRKRLMLLSIPVVLLLCFVGILLLPVTDQTDLPCRAEHIPSGTIESQAAGRLERLEIDEGTLVRKGQLVAVVVDDDSEFQLKLIDRQLASLDELLRFMKSGGTAADEVVQRRTLKALKKKLAEFEPCTDKDNRCALELAAIREEARITALKVRHCEWQAYPDEIASVEATVEKTKQLREEVARKVRREINASQSGRVVELQRPKTVRPGAILARLADAQNFAVRFSHQTMEVGRALEITLGEGSAFQTFVGQVSSSRGEVVAVNVAADVSRVDLDRSCRVRLSERSMLLKTLFR